MPRQFTDSVETPVNLRFGADKQVNTSSGWENVPAAAKLLEETTTSLALNSIDASFQADEDRTDDLYAKSRALKNGIYDSAIAGDMEAEARFTGQLENLKIAERQGAISGTNSQIRQESLLKQTINRYPHLEEQIRRKFSSTRAAAQASREQFKDPVEEGRDALIQRAAAAGRPVSMQLDVERDQENTSIALKQMELRAATGKDLQNEFSETFDNGFSNMIFTEQVEWLDWARKQAEASGDFNADAAKANWRVRKNQVMNQVQSTVNKIVRNSPNPESVLSKEFVDSKKAQIAKQFDDMEANLNSLDTLTAYTRASEIGKYESMEKLKQYSPMLNFVLKLAPESAAQVFKDLSQTESFMKNRGVESINMMIAQTDDPVQKDVYRVQRDMIAANDGLGITEFYKPMVGNGTVPRSTGYPAVDAHRVNTVVGSTLNSNGSTPEMKQKVIEAAVDAEQKYSKPGEYIAPSAAMYKDAARAKQLREDPVSKKTMTETINQTTPTIIRTLDKTEALDGLTFAPQMEQESGRRNPWEAYETGGPWGVSAALMASDGGLTTRGVNPSASKVGKVMQALNNNYWGMRNMYGPAKAEDYAAEVLDLMKERSDAKKAEAEAKKKKAE